ncbi:hypothetical protein TRM7615_04850 [Falsiruegeria mediterranea M17]|uniref:Uncharacterized protein n=1 Tax=Falsiruegeria mediterranea M17 TaxID=1200281 RepID=A0A2R8CFX4_9RHOB|nr:hypothetical protein TRM7615_04850 [Falsiruegeria mediterranea M17]
MICPTRQEIRARGPDDAVITCTAIQGIRRKGSVEFIIPGGRRPTRGRYKNDIAERRPGQRREIPGRKCSGQCDRRIETRCFIGVDFEQRCPARGCSLKAVVKQKGPGHPHHIFGGEIRDQIPVQPNRIIAKDIGARAPGQGIGPHAPRERINTRTAIQAVIVRAPRQQVVIRLPKERIRPGLTDQLVIPVSSGQAVCRRRSKDHITVRGTVECRHKTLSPSRPKTVD